MRQGKRIIQRLLVPAGLVLVVFWLDEFIRGRYEVLVWNSGIAFGIRVYDWLFAITACLSAATIYWLKAENQLWMLPILAGGWVNNYYRYTGAGVMDYWKIPGTNIFNNLADWVIFGGIILYIWQNNFSKKMKI